MRAQLARLVWANARLLSGPPAAMMLPASSVLMTLCLSAAAGDCQCSSQMFIQHQQQWLPQQPFQGFVAHYASKGRKSGKHKAAESDDDEAAAAAAGAEVDEPEFDLEPVERLMEQAIEHFEQELAGVRTGRANPGLLENLLVDASGDHIPIKACGTVTVRNPQLLAVVLFDTSLAKSVEKAIKTSPLGLTPVTEGAEVLVQLPRMTQDTIDRMVKLVHMEAEGAHQSIRRARQKGMDAIKKAFKSASQDEKKRQEKEVQKLHDQFIAEVEKLKKAKDTELREHRV